MTHSDITEAFAEFFDSEAHAEGSFREEKITTSDEFFNDGEAEIQELVAMDITEIDGGHAHYTRAELVEILGHEFMAFDAQCTELAGIDA